MQGSLTPSLLCCQSGNIDDCGVCDGDGSACPKAGSVAMDTATSTSPTSRKLTHGSIASGLRAGPHGSGSALLRLDVADQLSTMQHSHSRNVLAVEAQFTEIVAEFEACMCTVPLLHPWVRDCLQHIQAGVNDEPSTCLH